MSNKEYIEITLRRAKTYLSRHKKALLISSALFVFSAFFVLVAEVSFDYAHYAAVVDARLGSQSFHQPAGMYAAPRRVSVGEQINRDQFIERLKRVSYLEGQADEFAAGAFILKDGNIEMQTNDFARSESMPAALRIKFNKGEIVKIEDRDTGASQTSFLLPAELLTADLNTKRQERQAISYEDLPPVLIQALCAAEDQSFFSHHGISPEAIVRAAYRNFQEGRIREGGSTITQQLIKNQFLTSERTWKRKYAEALMAIALERRLSKQQIMTIYCNNTYLGQSGLTAIYGFKQAARIFFGKDLHDISISEAAFLAGLVKSPNHYTPYSQSEKAMARRDLVLDAMTGAGYISSAQAAAGKQEILSFLPPQKTDFATAPHFVDYVRRELAKAQGDEIPWAQVQIETTLDLDLQQAANQAVTANLERINKLIRKNKTSSKPEAALVAINPQTGEILAMVGGSSYANSQLNRATDAMRQPGSAFKPVIYATALSRGLSPASTFTNSRHDIEFGYKAVYRPNNYGHSYSNAPVTLRDSLVRSLNIVAVDAAMQAGLGNVASMAERLGLPRPQPYPSMALGASEVTPLDLARAYSTFANNGVRVDPIPVRACKLNGETIVSNDGVRTTVLSPSINYLITDALADVVNRGTAARVRQMGYKGPAAGKTGTSRDAWFVGYTPKLLIAVWVGYDDNTDLKLTGGEAAVPIWADFLKRALELRPDLKSQQFSQPGGLETAEICSETGALANEYCPHRQKILLAAFMFPGECFQHQAPVVNTEDAFLNLGGENVESEQLEKAGMLESPDASSTDLKQATEARSWAIKTGGPPPK